MAYLSYRKFLVLETGTNSILDRPETKTEDVGENKVTYTPIDFEIYHDDIYVITGDTEIGNFRLSIFKLRDNRLILQFISGEYSFDEFAEWNFLEQRGDEVYLNILKGRYDGFPTKLRIIRNGKKYTISQL